MCQLMSVEDWGVARAQHAGTPGSTPGTSCYPSTAGNSLSLSLSTGLRVDGCGPKGQRGEMGLLLLDEDEE